MLVDTGATFTKAPRDLLERLGVPVEGTYTAELADGSRVQRTRGRTMIRLQGKEFPTPVTFGEDGEQNLLGAMALEDAMLAVDPHSRRLMPVDALEMTNTEPQRVHQFSSFSKLLLSSVNFRLTASRAASTASGGNSHLQGLRRPLRGSCARM